jgi:hypothetical protein
MALPVRKARDSQDSSSTTTCCREGIDVMGRLVPRVLLTHAGEYSAQGRLQQPASEFANEHPAAAVTPPDGSGPRTTAYETFMKSFMATIARGGVIAVPGAGEALSELSARGVAICLMTGFPARSSPAVVDTLGWRGLFDYSVSSDEVVHGRPKPDMILGAAKLARCPDLGTVAVVGDTDYESRRGSPSQRRFRHRCAHRRLLRGPAPRRQADPRLRECRRTLGSGHGYRGGRIASRDAP